MSNKHLNKIKNEKNPYDCKGTSKKIIKILEKKEKLNELVKKKFFDLEL